MPHLPDHQTDHDPLLIAAFASGDAGGADLERARDLVAACDDCAALHHDLRALAAAMPALPAPVRRRDFTLTPEQAASLRPAGWRRLLAPLAGPRFAFAAPLGGSLAALGIAGILVAGAAGMPLVGSSGAPSAERQADGGAPAVTQETGLEALSGAASEAPSLENPAAFVPPDANTGPAASDDASGAGLTGPADKASTPAEANRPASSTAADASIDATSPVSATPTTLAVGVVSGVLLVVGAVLLVGRLASRRLGSGT